jgi:alcohol dehydrogenase (cytochrome c)
LNFFTNGLSGTITAIDMRTGMIKWNYRVDFPPLVSPLVTQGLVFSGYIPFTETTKLGHIGHPRSHQIRTGVMLALDSNTGKKMWTAAVKGPIGVGGASVGDEMLFVPTGKVQSYKGVGGSIVAFGLP